MSPFAAAKASSSPMPSADRKAGTNPGRTVRQRKVGIAVWSSGIEAANGQAIVTRRVMAAQESVEWTPAIYVAGGRGCAMASVAVAAARLWSALLRGRASVTYVVCSRSNAGFLRDVPALLPALLGWRTVVHVHGSDIADLLVARQVSPLARWFYRRCEIIVPSAHVVEALAGLPFQALHMCENFLPGYPGPEPLHATGGPLRVAWNSNILASKGFFDVAEGVRAAVAAGTPVRLVAVGAPLADPEMDLPQVEARLAALRAEPWFEYLGPVRPEAASDLVDQSDLVALPSRYASECQPLALIQAMCRAKEVLVLDTPALRATAAGYPARVLPDAWPATVAGALAVALAEREARAELLSEAATMARRRFSSGMFDARMQEILVGP
ncbi:glycosyltransferase [Rubellimicrobium rubrum]|uniref:Glycosyltransferase n=1 Tax=Rubellimicrobium rubrum TaxID=2585369 RepID=A0A5C4MM40_9RHOB|nr:glycosyltransferase [Rubellimicrobium rubrum]TNC46852.1 glycosyltransferase [Rubellimicrobium rubrum]